MIRKKWSFYPTLFAVLSLGLLFSGCDLLGSEDDDDNNSGGGSSGTPVAVMDVGPIGSNNNATYGSSVDLDSGMAYLSAAAATRVPELDMVYAYSGTDNVDKVFTPSHAKASGYGFAANWSDAELSTIAFVKANVSGQAAFDTLDTQEEVKAIYDSGTELTTSSNASTNDLFVFRTNKGVYALVLVASQTPGAAGQIMTKVAK